MLEANVEGPVVHAAERAGYMVRKLKWIGRRAAMDRLFTRADTGPIFIEFKAPGKGPDPLQEIEIDEAREHGMRVHVIDNVADGLRVLGLAG